MRKKALFRAPFVELPILFRADEYGFAIADEGLDVVADGSGKEISIGNLPDVDPLHAHLKAVGLRGRAALLVRQLAQKNEVGTYSYPSS